MKEVSIAYEYKNGLYLNITNKCPTSCIFCIKRKWEMEYRDYNLNLKGKEPSLNEVINIVEGKFLEKDFNEIVFCGYGEPTMRFDLIKEFSNLLKNNKIKIPQNKKIRINTNGLGNLINKRDITIEMKDLIDSLHISLNTLDKNQWYKIMAPFEQYKEGAYESVLNFIENAKKNIKEVFITAVDLKEVNTKEVEKFALKEGLGFRLRPILENEI